MSHFTVLVVAEDVEAALAPYHEFECTGLDDQYVQNIDMIEEARAKYETDTALLIVERPTGERLNAFDEGSYVEELRPFYDENTRKLSLPDGWKEHRDLPAKDWEDFAGWASFHYGLPVLLGTAEPDTENVHKYGWVRVIDGDVTEVIDRTNPNAKWDWWELGGRWQGLLMLKPNAQGEVGRSGVMGSNSGRGGSDSCRVQDVDWEAMKAVAEKERQEEIGTILREGELDAGELETAIREKARLSAIWSDLPEPRPRGGDYVEWMVANSDKGDLMRRGSKSHFWRWPEIGDKTIPEWIASAPALQTFAVIKDGEWYEKGKMGWWASVSDEKADWPERFQALIEDLPADAKISIVDCHI